MMDMKKMGQQMMEFYKTTFDNSFNTLMMCQNQMESLGTMYWGQMVSLPEGAKKDMAEWSTAYKKNCAEFKKAVDDGFQKLESFYA
jgi:hypothetical protein